MISDHLARPATLWDFPADHYDRIGQLNYLSLARLITAEWVKRGIGTVDQKQEAYYQSVCQKEDTRE